MDIQTVLAVGIFLFTLILVIWQPKGLSIGWSVIIGAVIALLAGVVSLKDVWTVTQIVWDATVAFVGIIFISLILDKIGFFEWSALHIMKRADGDGKKLFVYIILLGALIAAFFANDGAALMLTPIVYAKIKHLGLKDRFILPFIMASGFVADTTSLPLVISNLVNIVTADFFGIGFIEYAFKMIVPNLFSLLSTLIVLYLYFREDIVKEYDPKILKNPDEVIKDWFIFKIAWWLGGALIIGFIISEIYHIPVSIIITIGAIILGIATYREKIVDMKKLVFKETPWKIVVFSIGMYVVVYGLKNVGLTGELAKFIKDFQGFGDLAGIVGTGFLAAVLSAVMNNMPSVMIVDLSIADTGLKESVQNLLAYANIIGCDLGPKITPIGSLATLLWLHVLEQKGVKISWGYYFKTGIILTPPVLLFTLIGLYLWNLIIGG
ncbi:arsenite efflux membrane protein ArsB [Persephonella hydrogeniphila]|uniref:Arsenical pump membrane protein n=1 Tax=Persephonella hydrogeniphila TaxID=198703 RepID=A0A285NKL1_9AQUI|nr:arsenite efflux membrane protein ArsB [Persephonella hydrogeniphila]